MELHIMTKLLLQLVFIPLVFGAAHADENPDYKRNPKFDLKKLSKLHQTKKQTQ